MILPQNRSGGGKDGVGRSRGRPVTNPEDRNLNRNEPGAAVKLDLVSGTSGFTIMPGGLICSFPRADCSQLTDVHNLCTYVNSRYNIRLNVSINSDSNSNNNTNRRHKMCYNENGSSRICQDSALRKRTLFSSTSPLSSQSLSPLSPLSTPGSGGLFPRRATTTKSMPPKLPASKLPPTNSQLSSSKHFQKASASNNTWTMSLLLYSITVLCFLSIHGIVVVAEASLDIIPEITVPDSKSRIPNQPVSVPQYPFSVTKDYEDPCKAGTYS